MPAHETPPGDPCPVSGPGSAGQAMPCRGVGRLQVAQTSHPRPDSAETRLHRASNSGVTTRRSIFYRRHRKKKRCGSQNTLADDACHAYRKSDAHELRICQTTPCRAMPRQTRPRCAALHCTVRCKTEKYGNVSLILRLVMSGREQIRAGSRARHKPVISPSSARHEPGRPSVSQRYGITVHSAQADDRPAS